MRRCRLVDPHDLDDGQVLKSRMGMMNGDLIFIEKSNNFNEHNNIRE